jgi:hypothetical protein
MKQHIVSMMKQPVSSLFRMFLWAGIVSATPFLYSLAQAQSADPDFFWHRDHHAKLVQFDPPGTGTAVSASCGGYCGTFAYANNDEGTVVGTYTDEYVVPHGFLRTPEGHFVSFDAPGAGLGHYDDEGTVAYTINDFGVIAGQYQDSGLLFHAFIRYPNGSFVTFESPSAGTGAYTGTFAFSINIEGETAGVYYDAQGAEHGFVRSREGKVTEFDPPNSQGTMVCEETCLNVEGTTVGFFYDSTATIHGFLRARSGAITVFDAPGAGTGNYTGTVAASITDEGEIAGYFVDASNIYHGFVRHCDGKFTTFEVPQADAAAGAGTVPYAIDIWGVTTGIYIDSNSVFHGFSRKPDGHVATFDAPHAGGGAFQGTRPSTNNILGEVTGWYTDAAGLNHGFIWTP